MHFFDKKYTSMSQLKTVIQFPLTRLIAGVIFCLGIMTAIQTFIAKPVLNTLFENKIIADSIRNCISFALLVVCYNLFTRYYEKRANAELQLTNWKKEIAGGFVIGFVCISISILIMFIAGFYFVENISSTDYNLKLFTVLVLAAFIEDLLIRAFAVRIFEQWLGTYPALIIIGGIELLHFFNDNESVNIISVLFLLAWGFTLGILFVYSKRVWLPFAFHTGWNFAQPFYGSNLSGQTDMGKIIKASFSGPVYITGGATGIESSVFTVTILLIVGIIFLRKAIKENKIVKAKLRSCLNLLN